MSWLDVILIAIMLISGFLAMVRGFTREVLSIFSWAMAAVAALYLTPKYAKLLHPYISNPSIAQIVFAAGVFIVTLIVVSLITFRVSDSVLDSRVGAVDRTLGFIFGIARGFLLVAIVFMLFTALAEEPTWIREARSYNLLKWSEKAIWSLMPQNPDDLLRMPNDGSQPEGQPGAKPEGQQPEQAQPDQRS